MRQEFLIIIVYKTVIGIVTNNINPRGKNFLKNNNCLTFGRKSKLNLLSFFFSKICEQYI